MFRHLLHLAWKRKSRNVMLSLEILLAFCIVFGVAAFGVRFAQLYDMPLGFDGGDVWSVRIEAGDNGRTPFDASFYDSFRRGLAELPEVRDLAFASFEPYSMSTFTSHLRRGSGSGRGGDDGSGKEVHTNLLEADDQLDRVLGLTLAEGRWFSDLDNGSAYRPAVINRRMAETMFPGERALGQHILGGKGAQPATGYRVVGVVDEFRAKGELSAPVDFAFLRMEPGKNDVRTILLKVKPGTERSFETRLSRRLKLIKNDWSYQITPVSTLRASMLRIQTTPLIVVAVVAAFMLLMVAFGLFGALWQNTTQRIPEIGLRRALGASAGQIYRQIVAEQILLSSGAILLGLLLLVQLPLTGALGESLNWTVFSGAALLATFVIYLISSVCAVYPGWRASRLSPTEALHYE